MLHGPSMQFTIYSQYYDLFYNDKDYCGESDYVRSRLNQYRPDCSSVLELGCGTGQHASLFAASGLHVTGVERSPTMLAQSQERVALLNAQDISGSFTAIPGDARTVRVARHFDAVISLFHVVSYQTTNCDVQQMFETAATHLNQGGVFLFDVWYGPAVLNMKPTVRVKRMENDAISVLRIAEPTLHMNQCRVDVKYTVFVTDQRSGHIQQFTEDHHMRYYFTPELEMVAQSSGFDILHSEEWLTAAMPSQNTWGVTFIARKK